MKLNVLYGISAWLVLVPILNSVFAFDSVLLDRNGQILDSRRTDFSVRELSPVKLGDISAALKTAVLISEDHKFYDHHGVDWLALAGSSVRSLFGSHYKRGASTITMQWAGLEKSELSEKTDRPTRKNRRRNIGEKWDQIQEALALEKRMSKDQIFENYLNRVDFRGEYRGVHAASVCLFQKDPNALNADESSVLASLIRSPNAKLDLVRTRACELRLRAFSRACIRSDNLSALVDRLKEPGCSKDIALAPVLSKKLLTTNGQRIVSTVDRSLQFQAQEIVSRHLNALKSENVSAASAVVMNNQTGEVIAYIAGDGVDRVNAKRQAGSILKPFFYAEAIEKKLISASSLIKDRPFEEVLPLGRVYRPENYDHRFHGDVSARVALASSLNIPAIHVLNWIGIDEGLRVLKNLGIQPEVSEEENYGSSLALGSVDVSLIEVTNAYRALSRGGLIQEYSLLLNHPSKKLKRVFSNRTSFVIGNILSDREARSLTFGLENTLSTPFWTAVKTGTSKDMRDNWCVGYSEKYTVGVWAGNENGSAMWNVAGITGAAPIWRDLMKLLHEKEPSRPPKVPQGLAYDQGEYRFNEMSVPVSQSTLSIANVSLPKEARFPKIHYPENGLVVAVDPEIPLQNQRIFFESTETEEDDLEWELNGKKVSSDVLDGGFEISKNSGHQVLKLIRTADHKVLDQSEFILKTAAVR